MRSPPDRGLSRERTGLAWERSALSFATLAGVALAAAAHRDAPALLLLAAALVVVAVLVWRHSRRAYASAAVTPQPRAIAWLALVTALAALGAAAAVVARL
jgi:uncharacterized protein DUF202